MLTQLTNRVPVLFKSLLSGKLDAPELLTQDHLKVEGLFLQLRFLNQVAPRLPSRKAELKKRREALFEEIRDELQRHAAAEEAIFYPECEKHGEIQELINESVEEHRQIKSLLGEMSDLSVDHESFEAKLAVLAEDVSHHVREEEEQVFPKARRLLSRTRLERMASQIRAYKRQKKGSAAA